MTYSGIPVSVLLGGGLLVVLLVQILYTSWKSPLSALPGPWHTKWTGAVTTYYWFIGQRPKYVHTLHEKYGAIVRVSPTEVHVNDIPAVREIHKVGGPFVKSEWYQTLTNAVFETVFNTNDFAYHSRLRKLLSGPISDANLKQYEPIITDRVRLAMQRIEEEIHSRGAADIFQWATFLATDVIGELTFGESFRMLERREKNQYTRDLETIASFQPLRTTFPFLVKAAKYLNLGTFRRVVELSERLQRYGCDSLQRYHDHLAQNPTNPKPTLFTKIYNAEKENSLTYKELLANAQAYIVAGSDTTALTLTCVIYAVCGDSKVREQLVEELQSLPENYTDKDCRALTYLNNVITESMRVFPVVVSALPRLVPPAGAILAGYPIPGRTTVSTQAYSLHRNPAVFADPEKFDPIRWENPTQEMKESFMPFGGGSRICLGIHLARIELRLATAHFFRRFPNARVSSKEGMSDKDMEMNIWFLAQPKGHRCLIEA